MIINYKLILLSFISSLFLNFILVKFKLFQLDNKVYQIQDIHIGNPSRLGGLIIVFLFFAFSILYINELNINLIISCLVILLISLLEDIRISVSPLVRLFFIFSSSLFLIVNLDSLPLFEFGILNILFNNYFFQVIFFTLAIVTVINGQNIIDGTNGLSAMTALSIFSSILFLGFFTGDQKIILKSTLILSLIIGFLFFNYPFGKIFLGDSGSYFLGLMASYLVIGIFANNPQLPSWSAVTILFYPTLEVCFSYFRKIFQNKSPFLPDNQHLHLKIYYLISQGKGNRMLYNALVTPFLGVIWLSPLALLPFSLVYTHWSLLVLCLLVLVYLFFYYSIPNTK